MLFEEYAQPIHSPVRTQYLQVKQQNPDAILFFRMGDFYEMFDEDAEIVARELEIVLTRRDFGRGEKSPMAGIPHHAADAYIARLVSKGYRVAVCEQVSDPALSRGLVEREVIRIVTPGTVTDPAMLAAKRNNFLAGVVVGRDAVGIAYVDITTGEFAVTQFSTPEPELALQQEIARVGPAEVLVEAHYASNGNRKKRWLAAVSKGESGDEQEGDHVFATSARSRSPKKVAPGSARNDQYMGSTGDPGAAIPEIEEADEEDEIAPLAKLLTGVAGHVTPYDARYFAEDDARQRLLAHFEVASLEGFGCAHLPLAIRAAGAVLAYLQETQRGLLHQLTALETYDNSTFMTLDPHTRRNLELFESGRNGSVKGSLLWVLDRTRSPMGGRLLRRWIGQPLLDLAILKQRQQVIGELLSDTLLQARLAESLKKAGDIERLSNRVRQRIATPRDMLALAHGLRAARDVMNHVRTACLPDDAEQQETGRPPGAPLPSRVGAGCCPPQGLVPARGAGNAPALELTRIMRQLADHEDVIALIESALVDVEETGRPPGAPLPSRAGAGLAPALELTGGRASAEGGVIRPGFNTELDTLKLAAQDGQQWIAQLEQRERKRTGINNLKVGYNKVFGYYIEVTNSNASRVPTDYVRKATLSNAERFITPDLKDYEALVLNAQERISKLEGELFARLRAEIAISASERIRNTAHALAEIDVYLSLAQVAAQHNYCRPHLGDGDTIHIVAGRHPVVEQAQSETPFIPNDAELSNAAAQILIITGPNMAGKSTYLRQVALITLMAQIGSYVPAEAATIGLVDRIFTRIGAQDDLATGQSTFMVEMVETANILHHATPRSLVILDEIGRGTSTYDGLAIARAVIEYLHNNKRCGARTLFATHYHELVEVAQMLPRMRCMNVAVTEEGGKVVFLRKIVPGGADKSYGVHVAQLAGIPRPVIHRAEEILVELERVGARCSAPLQARRKAMKDIVVPSAMQMTLFAAEPHPLVEEIKNMVIDELTPIEAISKLYELQQRAKKEV